MIDLEYLTQNSGDAILQEYSYSEENLIIVLTLDEIEQDIKLTIKTEAVSFDIFPLEKKHTPFRTCRIKIENLSDVLATEKGYYTPNSNFEKLMDETRKNYNLAYGKKSTEMKYIFSLVGYGRLLSCLLSDIEIIKIEVLN
ncbi:hypothetical protein ASG38_11015 [Flavobacterium sp. Leaf359]|uniref:hypothetical protein n=1 Tax=Flavobacterium sp. Leaf359 TaxID=1736351 RepID=UPI0006F6AB2A|nr:hypothetical protein [Flavobacterium sp. Leaf359]KQS46336.1 hypothetical protein ASG38_11015 [Flavobacterium sp. Leaf359]PZQ86831.1 MAG: hypothetical protein DI548_06565 [Flavobacterium johnsoniae]